MGRIWEAWSERTEVPPDTVAAEPNRTVENYPDVSVERRDVR